MLTMIRVNHDSLNIEDTDKQFGVMLVEGKPLCTIERPWIYAEETPAGKPNESSIPAGEYRLVKSYSTKFKKKMFYMVNEDLGVFLKADQRTEDWQRFRCMFHPANWVRNIQGCTGVGRDIRMMGNDMGVTSSVSAVKVVMDYLDKQEDPMLRIVWSEPCI